MHVPGRGAVYKLREFNKRCRKEKANQIKEAKAKPEPMPFYEEPRRSERKGSPTFSSATLIDEFTGLPPQGAKMWTKDTLSWFMDNLFTSNQKPRPFLLKIIAKGRSMHQEISPMYRMYKNGRTGVHQEMGRPPTILTENMKK